MTLEEGIITSQVSFDKDIFISYAHLDDEPLKWAEQGWIATFHQELERRLNQVRGKYVEIWRDSQLRDHGYFESSIALELGKVRLLVSVVTPRYLESEYCQQELHLFCRLAAENGGICVGGDKSRILKVVKTPVDRNAKKYPTELKRLLGYEFFEIDQKTRRFREFDENYGPDSKLKFAERVDDLSQDINDLLNQLDSEEEPSNEEEPPSEEEIPIEPAVRGVYLAETISGLQSERDNLRRELKNHGFQVFPQEPLSTTTDTIENEIRQCLQKCELSIHLLGEKYGTIPEGEAERSVVELQQQLAQKARLRFGQMVWVPQDLEPSESRQEAYIQSLRDDLVTELLQTTLNELKNLAKERLLTPPQEPQLNRDRLETSGPHKIYLVCDRADLESPESRDNLWHLEDYLFDLDIKVIPTSFDFEDESDIRRDYEKNLCECDGVLIYYDRGSSDWLHYKLRDLTKALGFGRDRDFLAKAVYVTGDGEAKEDFRTNRAMVIRYGEPFDPERAEPLQAFLRELSDRGGEN